MGTGDVSRALLRSPSIQKPILTVHTLGKVYAISKVKGLLEGLQ